MRSVGSAHNHWWPESALARRQGQSGHRLNDLRWKAGSDKDAQKLLGHTDVRTTRGHYRAKPQKRLLPGEVWEDLPNSGGMKKATIARGLLNYGARSWTRTNDPLINSQVL